MRVERGGEEEDGMEWRDGSRGAGSPVTTGGPPMALAALRGTGEEPNAQAQDQHQHPAVAKSASAPCQAYRRPGAHARYHHAIVNCSGRALTTNTTTTATTATTAAAFAATFARSATHLSRRLPAPTAGLKSQAEPSKRKARAKAPRKRSRAVSASPPPPPPTADDDDGDDDNGGDEADRNNTVRRRSELAAEEDGVIPATPPLSTI